MPVISVALALALGALGGLCALAGYVFGRGERLAVRMGRAAAVHAVLARLQRDTARDKGEFWRARAFAQAACDIAALEEEQG